MRKPMSDMTAQQFVEAMAALGFNQKTMSVELARVLKRRRNYARPTISNYATGKAKIPVEVAQAIAHMCRERAERLRIAATSAEDMIGKLIVHTNQTQARFEPHRTEGRFMRRQGEADTRTYPPYRLTAARMQTLLSALAGWQVRVRELAQQYTDEARQRDYALELADLKALVAALPRHAPYDVVIQRNEWDVISRALRHASTGQDATTRGRANALRIHWSRYKGCGFPPHRKE